jgi:hypothetical protein
MPVLNIFKSIFELINGTKTAGGLNKNDRRYFNRYLINCPDICMLKHPEKGTFKILNLSYQGALIQGMAGSTLDQLKLPTNVELSACGVSATFSIFKALQRDGLWVIHFEHSGEGSIQSMGSFVEPVRCGSSAVAMPTDPSKPLAPGTTRVRFFGDGPFDILIEKNKSGEITFIMATIRRGAEYGSVTWNNGLLRTQKTMDTDGVASRMGQTQDVDRKLVWTCAMACLGLNFPEGPACAKLLSESLASD